MHPKLTVLLAFPLMTLTAAGCMPWRGPADVRRDVHNVTGARYDREMGLTLGPTALSIARWGVRQGNDPDTDRVLQLLEGLEKVEVGVWQVRSRPDSVLPRQLRAHDFPGWFPMVEATPPDGESVLVLTSDGYEPASIRRMLVVVDDQEELVVVRMRGQIGHMLEEAIRYALDEAGREDLTDPTLDAYVEGRDSRS